MFFPKAQRFTEPLQIDPIITSSNAPLDLVRPLIFLILVPDSIKADIIVRPLDDPGHQRRELPLNCRNPSPVLEDRPFLGFASKSEVAINQNVDSGVQSLGVKVDLALRVLELLICNYLILLELPYIGLPNSVFGLLVHTVN